MHICIKLAILCIKLAVIGITQKGGTFNAKMG